MPCDESSMVSRAERLFSCFYMSFISSVKPRCIAIDFSESKLWRNELWPSIFANVVVFWKYDCSVSFVLPSSWHVKFHFCLFGVNVKHIFF